jgi:hypothetical protein
MRRVRPLFTLSARAAAVAGGAVVALGVVGSLIRLLPWLVAPHVPWRLALPFARLLIGSVVESALIVALPTGAALGAAEFVERGEARALLALGARPARMVASLVAPGLALVVLCGGAAKLEEDRSAPGRLATRLLDDGRAGCAGRNERRIDVPVLSVSWLCMEDGPWLAGRVPGLSVPFWFTSRGLRAEDDLRKVSLESVSVAGRTEGTLVRLRAAHAHVFGLTGWGGGSARLTGAARGVAISTSALAAALTVAWLGLVLATGPLGAVVVAAVTDGTLLAVWHAVDSRPYPPGWYGLVAVSGVVSAILASFLVSRRWRVAVGQAR